MSATDVLLLDSDGVRLLYLGPELDASLPSRGLDGLARRRLVALGQVCPCGARFPKPNCAARRAAQQKGHGLVTGVQVAHQDDCPAVSPELQNKRWRP